MSSYFLPRDTAADPLSESPSALEEERRVKRERIRDFLDQHRLAAVLLRRNENVAWMSCGAADRRVLLPADTGVASLLVRRDGQVFYLATNNEAPRLAAEDFAGLDFEPVITPWWPSAPGDELRRFAGTGTIGSNTAGDRSETRVQPADLAPLRASLTSAEIARYRWLGRSVARAVQQVLVALTPGTTESEMAARVSYLLLRDGIEPTVLLMAVDERVLRYKHAVAGGARLEHLGMINLCARRWGLAVSITRFVHFGTPPSDLAARFGAAARVNAALLAATRPGTTAGQLFAVSARAYEQAGFPGEERNHHQGGAAGYREREWLASPNGSETVQNAQAFAWNPSIQGGKVEDTVLLLDGRMEVLTPTPSLPTVETPVGASTYTSADVYCP